MRKRALPYTDVQGGKSALRCARIIMADPGACAATTVVALTSPSASQEEAASVTPEKEKPTRLAGPRIKPFGKRIRAEEEVGCQPLPTCEARPAIEQRPTNVSGHGLCAGRSRRVRISSASLPRWARVFIARETSTGSTSKSCTTEEVAMQRRRQ